MGSIMKITVLSLLFSTFYQPVSASNSQDNLFEDIELSRSIEHVQTVHHSNLSSENLKTLDKDNQKTQSSKTYLSKKGLSINYEWINKQSYLNSGVQKLLEDFIVQETMAKAINLSVTDGKNHYHECVTECLVAKHNERFIGFVSYEDYFDSINRAFDDTSSDTVKKFLLFYYELDDPFMKKFAPIKKNDFFYLTSAYVDNDYRSNGIMTELIKESERHAIKLGYKFILLEPSGREMQHIVTKKLNYQIINELHYKNFKYKDEYPFASIQKTPSCMLVLKNLTHKKAKI